MDSSIEKKTAKAFFYKLLERAGVQIISFVLSVVLARMLDPSDYGIIAMATIITNFLYVFVNYGLSSFLIYKSDTTDVDISTCFWGSCLLGVALYAILFFCAPLAADFFDLELLTAVIRVQGVGIIFSLINSIQVALIAKRFHFKALAICTTIAIVLSGILGIVLAYLGFGVWALVIQSLSNTIIVTVFLIRPVKWRPSFSFSFSSVKEQFSYSWKLIVVGVVDCVYSEIRSLAIAKKYDSTQLAYYNKADQFPKLITNSVDQTIISVFFPALSSINDKKQEIRMLMQKTTGILVYFLFPIIIGMLAVSNEFVSLLLTEKWISCVPYLKILSIAYLLAPIQYLYKQMLKATNNGRTLLIVNLSEKIIGVALLIPAIFLSVRAIAWSLVVYHIVGLIMYMVAGKMKIGFSIGKQIGVIAYNSIPAIIMYLIIIIFNHYVSIINPLIKLLIKVLIGVIAYLFTSIIIKNDTLRMVLSFVKGKLKKTT